jgi:acyl-CoA thioester hydrolase
MNKEHTLSASAQYVVRFNECDPMGIVWHGNFIKYFEEGREAFASKYGFNFLEIFGNGYALPIVHVSCEYKKPLKYKDTVLIETTLHRSHAAKIIFNYKIVIAETGQLACMGTTTQVFVNKDTMQLSLVYPDVFIKWAKQHGWK